LAFPHQCGAAKDARAASGEERSKCSLSNAEWNVPHSAFDILHSAFLQSIGSGIGVSIGRRHRRCNRQCASSRFG
jgi:hypothetical protein